MVFLVLGPACWTKNKWDHILQIIFLAGVDTDGTLWPLLTWLVIPLLRQPVLLMHLLAG